MSELVTELRAARPTASTALRERIAALTEETPAQAKTPRWSLPQIRIRRAALVLVPACLVLAVFGAIAGGIVSSGSSDQTAVPQANTAALERLDKRAPAPQSAAARARATVGTPLSADSVTQLPPNQNRYQDYAASMRIRLDDVDGLSDATVRAMRLARRLGGYVVSVNYGSEGSRKGDAYMTLRVPVARVQTAVVRLSGLGTLLAQNVRVNDLQATVDALERRIVRLNSEIDAVDAQLAAPDLSAAERAQLEFRRQRLAAQLKQATRSRQATIRRASFATVSLELTTEKREEQAAPPGRFERTFDDAAGILAAEAAWALLILAIVAPFAILLGLGYWGYRSAKRLADRRLLESS